MNKLPVSICILAYNEELEISDCIHSCLGWAEEIVVLDAESTDRTLHIVKELAHEHHEIQYFQAPNTKFFDANKMLIFEKATGNWLFYLDADERMTPELWQEIQVSITDSPYNGFSVGRKNFFLGKWMQHGGMYPEKQPRLFRKGHGSFKNPEALHEPLIIDGSVGDLTQNFLHYSYRSVKVFMAKQAKYTEVQAENWQKEGLSWTLNNHIKYGLIRPFARFVQKYFVLAGWRDGFLGFFAAWMAGQGEFLAYVKLYDCK